ncbi:MAG: hypothetical protein JO061_13405, partial [Acidobacteriaceae bacterium]|nr:hypothetical protein [Acidobacteriaceae bacterium]
QHIDLGALKPDSPANLVSRYAADLASAGESENEALDLWSPLAPRERVHQFVENARRQSNVLAVIGAVPRRALVDLALSNRHVTTDANGQAGFRVRSSGVGAQAVSTYVVRSNGEFRILGDAQIPDAIGRLVLSELDHGDTASARRWLDWVRDDIKIHSDDDPLGGPMFPRVWTRASDSDEKKMRYAAATLIFDRDALPILKEAIDSTSEPVKSFYQMAYLQACVVSHAWETALPFAEQVTRTYPESDAALGAVGLIYAGLNRLQDLHSILQARIDHNPDDLTARRQLAETLAREDKFVESEAAAKQLTEISTATATDWNQYGWTSLFAGDVTEEKIDGLQRADSRNIASILHTLASMYAEIGKGQEARETILQAMTAWGLDEPNSDAWYVFGRIAEQYGVPEAAAVYYGKVEPPKDRIVDSLSTYSLAQRRLAGLRKSASHT